MFKTGLQKNVLDQKYFLLVTSKCAQAVSIFLCIEFFHHPTVYTPTLITVSKAPIPTSRVRNLIHVTCDNNLLTYRQDLIRRPLNIRFVPLIFFGITRSSVFNWSFCSNICKMWTYLTMLD